MVHDFLLPPAMPAIYRLMVLLLLLGGPAEYAAGQMRLTPSRAVSAAQPAVPAASSLDRQVLRAVYHVEAPLFRGVMRGADRSAYPVFFGAPVAAWGGAWLVRGGDDWSDAYRLTVAQAATYGAVKSLKTVFQRPRPYRTLSDIRSRSARYSPSGAGGASFAFPSGHASMAFAIATSWSLSHPEWYIIGPGAVWASAVALSRVWLGVHYPSDVLAGALLGTAMSVVIHAIGPSITPSGLEPDASSSAPALQVRIRL